MSNVRSLKLSFYVIKCEMGSMQFLPTSRARAHHVLYAHARYGIMVVMGDLLRQFWRTFVTKLRRYVQKGHGPRDHSRRLTVSGHRPGKEKQMSGKRNGLIVVTVGVLLFLISCGGGGFPEQPVPQVVENVNTPPPSCPSGTELNTVTGGCVEVVYHYGTTTVLNENAYPHIMGSDGVPVPAKNETGYGNAIPIWNIWYAAKWPDGFIKQPNGSLYVLARISALGGRFAILSHNVRDNTLTKFEGTLPDNLKWDADLGPYSGSYWYNCQRYCTDPYGGGVPPFTTPDIYAWAEAPSGGYWGAMSLSPFEIWRFDDFGNGALVYKGKGTSFMLNVSN